MRGTGFSPLGLAPNAGYSPHSVIFKAVPPPVGSALENRPNQADDDPCGRRPAKDHVIWK